MRELGLQDVTLGADAPTRLAVLRAETGLKLPDCCVLLAAEDVGANALLTLDDALAAGAVARGVPVRGASP